MISKQNRAFLAVGYPLGIMLIVIPLAEIVFQSWPATPGAIRWRYGLVGYIGNGLFTPLAGYVLLMLTAILLGHLSMLKTFSVSALLGGLLFLGMVGVFVQDAVALREQVSPQLAQSYDSASLKATASLLLGVVVLLWSGWGGWRAARGASRDRRAREGAGPGVVSRAAARG